MEAQLGGRVTLIDQAHTIHSRHSGETGGIFTFTFSTVSWTWNIVWKHVMVGCIVHSTPSDCVERWHTSVRKQIRWTGILLSGSSAINPIMYENMPRHLDAGLSAFILMISTSETIDSSLCVGNSKDVGRTQASIDL